MSTRHVVLSEHQEELIELLVRSGRYRDASDVLREGLRLVEEREADETVRLNALRDAAAAGFASVDRGEFKQFDSIDDLQAYLRDVSEKIISTSGR
jgi:antitoxin ParD1/3/4